MAIKNIILDRDGVINLDSDAFIKSPEEFIFIEDSIIALQKLAAKNLNRNSVGYEINSEFIPLIEEKLGARQKDMNGTTYEFVKQVENKIDRAAEIQKLPYIFKDPHTLDKKIDVKKLQFGSKIDQDSTATREEFFTVKEVISPEIICMSNGLVVKLIGIKEDPIVNGKATEFLTAKQKGNGFFYDMTA